MPPEFRDYRTILAATEFHVPRGGNPGYAPRPDVMAAHLDPATGLTVLFGNSAARRSLSGPVLVDTRSFPFVSATKAGLASLPMAAVATHGPEASGALAAWLAREAPDAPLLVAGDDPHRMARMARALPETARFLPNGPDPAEVVHRLRVCGVDDSRILDDLAAERIRPRPALREIDLAAVAELRKGYDIGVGTTGLATATWRLYPGVARLLDDLSHAVQQEPGLCADIAVAHHDDYGLYATWRTPGVVAGEEVHCLLGTVPSARDLAHVVHSASCHTLAACGSKPHWSAPEIARFYADQVARVAAEGGCPVIHGRRPAQLEVVARACAPQTTAVFAIRGDDQEAYRALLRAGVENDRIRTRGPAEPPPPLQDGGRLSPRPRPPQPGVREIPPAPPAARRAIADIAGRRGISC